MAGSLARRPHRTIRYKSALAAAPDRLLTSLGLRTYRFLSVPRRRTSSPATLRGASGCSFRARKQTVHLVVVASGYVRLE